MIEDDDYRISVRAIWMVILKGGGRWTVKEIADELGATRDPVHRLITVMAKRGYIRRFEAQGKVLQFSVDRNCKIPLGVSMGELMDLGVAA